MIRRLLRTHWEGIVMALLMTVAFSLADLLDEPAPYPTCEGCGKTAVAARE